MDKRQLAYIDPNAKIGENVSIQPFAVIEENVEIGDNTWIGSNATIMAGTKIGANCRVFPSAVIGAVPQDLKFGGENTTVEIGDNNTIREFVTINRGTNASGKTVIGNNNLIMAYVHVAHDCIIGSNCVLANAVSLAGHIVVGDWAVIGGVTAIHQFVHIGEHVMISGGSLVRKDVPPYVTAGREPLSYAGTNSVGLRRRGFSNEQIGEIQSTYRILFQSSLNNAKAILEIKNTVPESEFRNKIISFIENSERGIMKGYS
ncbi:MAG: acyl-ACP--UDP-N-acetylglucosamine O-acyltransferase [Bacteroidales bacterium]|nr:acyl-ACP--UDP-N-acetylglucosamine O-acyltransferase [Bacteroidales bacterium]